MTVKERSARCGGLGLLLIGLSVAATFTVAVAGPSVMEPVLPGRPGQPPWAFDLRLSPYLAVGLTVLGLAAGAAGLVLVLRAMKGGWSVSARAVLLAGVVAAAVLTLVPPFGSSDTLSYAAYGRMVATGHNPYLTTPAQLAAHGDPVARAVQDWFTQPSVYGPLASGIQGLASLVGGTSARLTVFVLGLANLLAFVVAALLLYRMSEGPRRLRAMLLWTANPLLLQVLVAGGHVDTQQIACCVAAVAVLHRRVSPERAALAGALAGLGFAVKVSAALIVAGLALFILRRQGHAGARPAWTPRRIADPSGRQPPRPLAPARVFPFAPGFTALGSLLAGFAVVAGASVAIGGSAMLTVTSRASDMVSIGSPWRIVRTGLQHTVGHASAADIVKYGAILLALALATLMLRTNPDPTHPQWLPQRAKRASRSPGRGGPAGASRPGEDVTAASPGAEGASGGCGPPPPENSGPRGERSELRGRPAAGGPEVPPGRARLTASNPRTEGGSGGCGFDPPGKHWCGFHPPENTVLPLVVAWLFAWPYVLPWYDALGWAFLALAPASGLDWLMLARTTALGLAYLPARTADVRLPHGLDWLQPVFRDGVAPVVLLCATVWLVVIIVRGRYSALGDIGSVRSDRTVRGGDRHLDGDDRSSARHESGQGVHGADRGQRRIARDG